jgi:hypothetical protein
LACIGCARGFHAECDTNCKDCHEDLPPVAKTFVSAGNLKADYKVTDVVSTGRKRAARLYGNLMDKELPCEWRGKKNCGGGIPIYGCINGFRQDIHHGPDKNTLNNERSNIHLICKKCHKRWHFTNDNEYKRELWVETKHEPVDATHEELYAAELKWLPTRRSGFKVNEDAE